MSNLNTTDDDMTCDTTEIHTVQDGKKVTIPVFNRFAIIKNDEYGLPHLAMNNDERFHYATQEEAEQALKATLDNNSPDRLKQHFGDEFDTLRVRMVKCYANGYCISIL